MRGTQADRYSEHGEFRRLSEGALAVEPGQQGRR